MIDRATARRHVDEARARLEAARRIGDRSGMAEAHQLCVTARREMELAADEVPAPTMHEAHSRPPVTRPKSGRKPAVRDAAPDLDHLVVSALRYRPMTLAGLNVVIRRPGLRAALSRLVKTRRIRRIVERRNKTDVSLKTRTVHFALRLPKR